jgi:hypothetical protein
MYSYCPHITLLHTAFHTHHLISGGGDPTHGVVITDFRFTIATPAPTKQPTKAPTGVPPTKAPVKAPTKAPTFSPTFTHIVHIGPLDENTGGSSRGKITVQVPGAEGLVCPALVNKHNWATDEADSSDQFVVTVEGTSVTVVRVDGGAVLTHYTSTQYAHALYTRTLYSCTVHSHTVLSHCTLTHYAPTLALTHCTLTLYTRTLYSRTVHSHTILMHCTLTQYTLTLYTRTIYSHTVHPHTILMHCTPANYTHTPYSLQHL